MRIFDSRSFLRSTILAVACGFTVPVNGAAPVEVLVLGTYHLANPNQDLHNVEVGDITAEKRQSQLESVAAALATFVPNKVAVEAVSERADLSLAAYDDFEPAKLAEKKSETWQIGFRLAHRLEHPAVYGINERSEEIDYFPFDLIQNYVEDGEGSELLDDLNLQAARYTETVGRIHAEGSVGQALTWFNRPALIERMQRKFYYGLLELADANEQPGALLNGRYYLRNARIFAKLTAVAEPGDRIVVVFGAGHAYWLRHFVEQTPGYQLVEPNLYLSAAE